MSKCISSQGQWKEIQWVSVYLSSWNRTMHYGVRKKWSRVHFGIWAPFPRGKNNAGGTGCILLWAENLPTTETTKSPQERRQCLPFFSSPRPSLSCSHVAIYGMTFNIFVYWFPYFSPLVYGHNRGNALIACVSGTWPSTRHLVDAQWMILNEYCKEVTN